MKTVYFLGAGASRGSDFRLPVMKGFFRQEDLDSGAYPNLTAYITRSFHGLGPDELNLEDVISHLELSLEGFGAMWARPGSELPEARQEFDDYTRKRLSIDSSKVCRVHKGLFVAVSEEDTVLTLNYDLVADYALLDMWMEKEQGQNWHASKLDMSYGILGTLLVFDYGELPSLSRTYEGKGLYLKLHGSLSWVYCPNPSCGRHQRFFANPIRDPQSHKGPGAPCILCGTGLVSVIIPPAMSKSFVKFPKMGLIWNLAYRELKNADRWIMIGMSLPESDSHLRWLLREAATTRDTRAKVVVVNPSESAYQNTRQLLQDSTAEWIEEGIGGYVDNMKSLHR